MGFEIRELGDVTLIDLSGKLTRDGSELQLRAAVDELVTRGRLRIVLNLTAVPYMDSAGIGELVATRQKVAAAGGAVKLLNPLKRVYDILQLVKLDTIFETYQDEEVARESFAG
jgi:anti-sigma B factor antagonist